MTPICHVWNDTDNAQDVPAEHHKNGLLGEPKAAAWVEFAFNPNVSKQAVDNPGHAAKPRITQPSSVSAKPMEPELTQVW